MQKTIFEKIVDREIPASIVYENQDFLAFLDIQPKVLGHTLVIPKKPFKNLLEIPEELAGGYLHTIKKVAKGVQKGLQADGFNLVMNNDPAAHQEIPHAHIHIIPRFENDSVDMNPGTHAAYESDEQKENYRTKISEAIET